MPFLPEYENIVISKYLHKIWKNKSIKMFHLGWKCYFSEPSILTTTSSTTTTNIPTTTTTPQSTTAATPQSTPIGIS